MPASARTQPTYPEDDRGVGDLAALALSAVAARCARGRRRIIDPLADRLLAAAMGRSGESYRAVARGMLSMGVAPEQIADEYIPFVARRMGDEWTADTATFADVTIGSARLQAMLRDLATCWTADRTPDGAGATASAMVIVPQHTHHTLGASVLATQLRRTGTSVRLCLGMDPRALKVAIDHGRFDAVVISASLGDRLDSIRMVVDIARSGRQAPPPPIVVGGTILQQRVNVRRETGADLATGDICEALDFCRLPAPDVLH